MSLGQLTDSLQVAVNKKIHNQHVGVIISSVSSELESLSVRPPAAAVVYVPSPLLSPGSRGQPQETGRGGGSFRGHAEK